MGIPNPDSARVCTQNGSPSNWISDHAGGKKFSTDDVHASVDVLELGSIGAHGAMVDCSKGRHVRTTVDLLQLCVMQTASSANSHSYGWRSADHGLRLLEGAELQDHLPVVICQVEVGVAEKYLLKRKLAPKVLSPIHRCACQWKEREGQNPKLPAPPANSMTKTTAVNAPAGIVATMQLADAPEGK